MPSKVINVYFTHNLTFIECKIIQFCLEEIYISNAISEIICAQILNAVGRLKILIPCKTEPETPKFYLPYHTRWGKQTFAHLH